MSYRHLITVRQPRDTSVLWLSASGSSMPFLVVQTPSPNAVLQARMSLRRALDDVRHATHDHLEFTWPEVEDAFHYLHEAGALVSYQLFGTPKRLANQPVLRVSLAEQEGLPWAWSPSPAGSSSDRDVPFEVIPLFDLTTPVRRSTTTLFLPRRSTADLIGFSMVVRRLVARTTIGQRASGFSVPMRVTFLQDASLELRAPRKTAILLQCGSRGDASRGALAYRRD